MNTKKKPLGRSPSRKRRRKSLLIALLLMAMPVNAIIQMANERESKKIFISIGDPSGNDVTDANCIANIYDSTNTIIGRELSMSYESGDLYYFMTHENWNADTYMASFTCVSGSNMASDKVNFIIAPIIYAISEDDTHEEKLSWFDTIANTLPSWLGNFMKSLKNAFVIGLDIVYFIPKVLVFVFNLFVWVITHIYIIFLLFETYVLSMCLGETTLNGQISIFLQKNVYAIEFILKTTILIFNLGIRLIHAITTTISNLIPTIFGFGA